MVHRAAAGVNAALPYPALQGSGGAVEGGEGEPCFRTGAVPHAELGEIAAEEHGEHDCVVEEIHATMVVRALHALSLRGDVVSCNKAAPHVGEGLDGVEVENVALGFVGRAWDVDGAGADY